MAKTYSQLKQSVAAARGNDNSKKSGSTKAGKRTYEQLKNSAQALRPVGAPSDYEQGIINDLTGRLGDYDWRSTYTYDIWDEEDAKRKEQGKMPLYQYNRYDFTDPVDKYLYDNGLPPKKDLEGLVEKAEKEAETAAEETAYEQYRAQIEDAKNRSIFKGVNVPAAIQEITKGKTPTVQSETAPVSVQDAVFGDVPYTPETKAENGWFGAVGQGFKNAKFDNPGAQAKWDRTMWEIENMRDPTNEELRPVVEELLATGKYKEKVFGSYNNPRVITAEEQALQDARDQYRGQQEQKWLEYVGAPRDTEGNFLYGSKYDYEGRVVANEMTQAAVNAADFKTLYQLQAEAEAEGKRLDGIYKTTERTAQMAQPIYLQMTDEQKAAYYYYKERGLGDEYLDALTPELTDKAAEATKQLWTEEIPVPIIGDALLAFTGGLESGTKGLIRLATDNYAARTEGVSSRAAQQNRAEVAQGDDLWSKLAGLGLDVLYSTGNMVPSMVAGTVNPVLGAVTIGASSAGNAIKEARKEGATEEQAITYGLMSGTAEATLQYLLGGIAKLGKGVTGDALGKGVVRLFSRALKNPKVAQAFKARAGSILAEASEEYIQGIIDPVIRNIALNEDNIISLVNEEAGYGALLGAITGGLLGGNATVAENEAPVEQTYKPEPVDTRIMTGDTVILKDGSQVVVQDVDFDPINNMEMYLVEHNGQTEIVNSLNVTAQTIPETANTSNLKLGVNNQSHVTFDKMQQRQLDVLDSLAKKGGVPVVVVDRIDVGSQRAAANGSYDPKTGTIFVAADAIEGAYLYTGMHELTHHIKNFNAQGYTALENLVVDFLKTSDTYGTDVLEGRINELVNKGFTREAALEEIVADSIPAVLTDQKTVEKLVRKNRPAAERIRDFLYQFWRSIKTTMDKLTGMHGRKEIAALRENEKGIRKLYNEFNKALKGAGKDGHNTAAADGMFVSERTKRSDKEGIRPATIQESLQMDMTDERNLLRLSQDVTKVIEGKMPEGALILLGKPSGVLSKYLGSERPIYIQQKAIKKAIFPKSENGGKHGFGRVAIDELPLKLSDPIGITGNTSMHTDETENSVVIWTNWKTEAGDTVVVPIAIDVESRSLGTYNNVNTVFDVFDPEYAKDLLREGNVLYLKEGKSAANLQSDPQREVLKGEGSDASVGNSVPQDAQGVNADNQEGRLSTKSRTYDEALTEYGAIPKGANPARDVDVPQRMDDTTKVRQHVRTIMETGDVTEEMVEMLKDKIEQGDFSYTPESNKAVLAKVDKDIENSYATAYREWERTANGQLTPTAERIAKGERLLQIAAQKNDAETVLELTAQLAMIGTEAGRNLQAFSMLKKLGPVGEVYYLNKVARDFTNNMSEKLKARYGDVKLNTGLVNELVNAKTKAEHDAAYNAIVRDIANQIPATWTDRINAWRYMSMLTNPKTHIRNFLGNALFYPAVKMKNIISLGMERAFLRGENAGKRTKAVAAKKEYRDFAATDFDEMKNVLQSSGKYNVSNEVENQRRIFKNRFLEWTRKTNTNALEAEDVIFLRAHYRSAMAQYLQAKNADLSQYTEGSKQLEAAREYASQEALKATYRDASALTTWLSQGVHTNSKLFNAAANTLIEGTLPFKKTPVNIMRRGVEYSPLGLVKTLSADIVKLKNGSIDAAKFVDNLASGFTGSALMAVGMLLAANGIATGALDEKDPEERLRLLTGKQEYSIQIGGTSYTVDWVAPLSIPFFLGVELWNTVQEGKDITFATLMDTAGLALEPLFELSMLQGVNSLIETAGFSGTPITALLGKMAYNYLGQYIPSLGGALARIIDPVTRRNYDDKGDEWPSDISNFYQQAIAKVPILSKLREPAINAWGEEEITDDMLLRMFENLVSPGYVSNVEVSPVEKELLRLFKSTGSTGVIPSKGKQYFQANGERYDMTGSEYTTFSTFRGETAYGLAEALTKDVVYRDLVTDEVRAKCIEKAFDYANQMAKKTVVPDYKTDKWVGEMNELKTPEEQAAYILEAVISGNKSYEADVEGVGADVYEDAADFFTHLSENYEGRENSDYRKKQWLGYVNSIEGLTTAQRKWLYESKGNYDWDSRNK